MALLQQTAAGKDDARPMIVTSKHYLTSIEALPWRGLGGRSQDAPPGPTRMDLLGGLERGEFCAEYQPKVLMENGELVGVEALMRWNHARFWAWPADKVIALAEESGLVHDLGMQVLAEACGQLAQWLSQGRVAARVAVNVSVKQLAREGFSSAVIGVLLSQNIPPHLLTIEITESARLHDVNACTRAVAELKNFGIKISLDDFGTGFSSMEYLKMFQADEIKIDRSFVSNIEHSATDRAIVEAILSLGRSLGVSVVAEGIENWGQQRCLRRMGCAIGQGYLYGKPMPANRVVLGAGGSAHA